jgi:hypothetical protein
VNRKGSGRKKLWPNQGIILSFPRWVWGQTRCGRCPVRDWIRALPGYKSGLLQLALAPFMLIQDLRLAVMTLTAWVSSCSALAPALFSFLFLFWQSIFAQTELAPSFSLRFIIYSLLRPFGCPTCLILFETLGPFPWRRDKILFCLLYS